jgi:hypothetical protein
MRERWLVNNKYKSERQNKEKALYQYLLWIQGRRRRRETKK